MYIFCVNTRVRFVSYNTHNTIIKNFYKCSNTRTTVRRFERRCTHFSHFRILPRKDNRRVVCTLKQRITSSIVKSRNLVWWRIDYKAADTLKSQRRTKIIDGEGG